MKMRTLMSAATLAVFAIAALPVLAEEQKPPVMKNLKIWLTADAGITKNAAGKVSKWESQVEPKVLFFQDDVGSRPSFAADIVNGRPALSFGGCMLTSELPKDFVGDFSVFIVWSSDVEQKCLVHNGVNNRILSVPTVKGTDYQTGIQVVTGSKEVAKPGIASGIFPARPQLKYLCLGVMLGPDKISTGFPMNGNIAEVLIYNENLSEADISTVKKYLQEKYKITP